MKKINKKTILCIILMSIYYILILVCVSRHELWRDEVQHWVLARDLKVPELIAEMKWEGHPCLWHLILLPFTRLNFPILTMSYISALVMIIVSLIIVFRSPFRLITKVSLLLSAPFIYFYSIISRNYCLVALALVLLALEYKNRNKRPILYGLLIAFLMNTHVIAASMVGLIMLYFYGEELIIKRKLHTKKEKIKYIISLIISLFGILICWLQVKDSIGSNQISLTNQILTTQRSEIFSRVLKRIAEQINFYTDIRTDFDWFNYIIALISVLMIFVIIKLWKENKKTTIFFILNYLFVLFTESFYWFSIEQREYLVIPVLIFALWTNYVDKKDNTKISFLEKMLVFLCIITIPKGIKYYIKDFNEEVSGAKATSEFIDTLESDAVYLTTLDYISTSITGYNTTHLFYSIPMKRIYTYAVWDESWLISIKEEEFKKIVESCQKKYRKIYIIHTWFFSYDFDTIIPKLEDKGYIRRIYESNNDFFEKPRPHDEDYTIYEITDKWN